MERIVRTFAVRRLSNRQKDHSSDALAMCSKNRHRAWQTALHQYAERCSPNHFSTGTSRWRATKKPA